MRGFLVGLSVAALASSVLAADAKPLPGGLGMTVKGGERAETAVFDNLGIAEEYLYYFSGGPGAEVLDDCTADPNADFTSSSITVDLYNPGDDDRLTLLAYEMPTPGSPPVGDPIFSTTIDVAGDPENLQRINVGLTANFTGEFWFGWVSETGDTGLLMWNPPAVGSSDDLFLFDQDGPYNFGGDPVANFAQAVYVPEPASLTLLALCGLGLLRRR